jgi:hypothetical protein
MINMKIETFYTGGGITITEADINPDQYAVVSTECPELLAVYKYDDGGEKTHLPDDMVASIHQNDLAPELKAIHEKMLEKLKDH